jgi:hypothetical protein
MARVFGMLPTTAPTNLGASLGCFIDPAFKRSGSLGGDNGANVGCWVGGDGYFLVLQMALNAAQLRAFNAVAAAGRFTTAARTLNVTQPTLSNQVAALETLYEVRLFDRTPRGASLTPIGERLFELTQRHFALAEQAQQLLTASGT